MTDEMERFYRTVENFRECHIFSMIPWVTRGEFSVLKSIEICEQKYETQVGVSKMAQLLKQSPPMVSRALNSLEKKALIVREIDISDRRNTIVRLTEEGRALICKVDSTMLEFGAEVFETYGHEEMEALIRKISRLHEVMQSVLEKRMKESKKGDSNE